MSDEMGTFRTTVEIEDPAHPGSRRAFGSVLVDTGAELSIFPATALEELGITRFKRLRFRQADGSAFERWVGGAIIHAAGTKTFDEVVFGEPGDMTLLGARTLEGLNVRVDPKAKLLVDIGPMPLCPAA